jgi:hypothetical protein
LSADAWFPKQLGCRRRSFIANEFTEVRLPLRRPLKRNFTLTNCRRDLLKIAVHSLSNQSPCKWTIKKPGVNVQPVTAGGAAVQSGMLAGDRLLVLSHRWTDSAEDVFLAAGFVSPGKSVNLKVGRGTQELALTAKPIAGF